MKVQCPRCKAVYEIEDSKVSSAASYARCSKCRHRFPLRSNSKEISDLFSCPKCGHVQPPSPFCIKCGIIIAKYKGEEPPAEPAERYPANKPKVDPAKIKIPGQFLVILFIVGSALLIFGLFPTSEERFPYQNLVMVVLGLILIGYTVAWYVKHRKQMLSGEVFPSTKVMRVVSIKRQVLVIISLVAVFVVRQYLDRPTTKDPADEREKRQFPVTQIAPAALRSGQPLLGRPGKDQDGYPTQYVDQALLRSLLYHARYSELDAHFASFQDAFEWDQRFEYWPMDAADAFYSSEPELGLRLDAWIEASRNSFGAYLARGSHRLSLAWAMRGHKWASETSAESFREMEQVLKGAIQDFSHALELRPKLIAAVRRLIDAGRLGGEDAMQAKLIDRAVTLCPSCFEVRVAALIGLQPRWGGSYKKMLMLAEAAPAELNPRLRLLAGYIDLDQANLLLIEKKYPEALASVERACEQGEHWQFLVERANVLQRLNKNEEALTDLDRAALLRPGSAHVHFERAWVLARLDRYEASGLELLTGLRIDPSSRRGRQLFPSAVKGLIYEAWQHYEKGRESDAVRVLDLAIELDQSNDDATQRRTFILGGGSKPDLARVQLLEARHREAPDDLFTLRQLDYALTFATRDFQRIDALWTAYLERHPDEGRALVERGGTRRHLGRAAESIEDYRRACELGFSEGCALSKR